MRILLDRCVPKRLTTLFTDQHVVHASDLDWGAVSNGALVRRASEESFDVLVTVDRNMRFQTNISGLPLGVLIIQVSNNRFETLSSAGSKIQHWLSAIRAGEYYIVALD